MTSLSKAATEAEVLSGAAYFSGLTALPLENDT
jgi:hypothetical protein